MAELDAGRLTVAQFKDGADASVYARSGASAPGPEVPVAGDAPPMVRFRYPFLPTRLLALGCNLYSERSRPMKMTSRGLLLLMGLVASIALVREAGAQGITFQTTDLTLVTGTGRHYFTVYVANNNVSQTARGLRYLHEIPPNGGLLILQSQAVPGPIVFPRLAKRCRSTFCLLRATARSWKYTIAFQQAPIRRSLRRVRSRRRSSWPVVQ